VIQEKIEQIGYKAKTISITHLHEIQEAVAKLVRQGMISEQLHSTWHFYKQTNKNLPEAKTIIIVAMPQSFTRLRFAWQGTAYTADIPPTYFTKTDDSHAETILKDILGIAGYKVVKARLALKTLAVRSGLAKYGKNNISYVPGMGSFHQLVAFYSDCPCEKDNWQESQAMESCENCSLCYENCPMGSITKGRFLIHAEKCLGSLNERNPDFPYWVQLQPNWHNALIGCMCCQSVCPVNKPYLNNIVAGPVFSEEETGLIINRTSWENLPTKTRQELGDLQGIYPLITQNLTALIEKQKKII
jgi:epoxyqueuosine reductase